MNTLEQNLSGVIAEMALKLGLTGVPLSLNYPCASLGRMLGVADDPQALQPALDAFFAARKDLFGAAEAVPHEDGFCLTIPAEGVARVMSQAPAAAFLRDLIQTAQTPGATADDLLAAFRRHSDRVHVEPVDNDEFDLLVYFEDGVPDDFRYCIDQHDGFASYHRFSREDYEAFGF
ncbi:MAG TPA: DUF3877 family protein [Candidatus Limiplasma pullicola]|nr:DUF3877 family protein [Candidatus Limiplasma pullicola]